MVDALACVPLASGRFARKALCCLMDVFVLLRRAQALPALQHDRPAGPTPRGLLVARCGSLARAREEAATRARAAT